jgi:hypothetical protein
METGCANVTTNQIQTRHTLYTFCFRYVGKENKKVKKSHNTPIAAQGGGGIAPTHS